MNMFFAQASVAAQAASETAAAPAVTATETQPADGAAPAAPQQQGGFGMLMPMLLIFALFYFMLIRPQQRKEKERRKMIDELRAGRKVIFAGGLIGTIAEAKDKTFCIEIANGVVVEVARSSVQSVVDETPAAPSK